jgi:phenylalanyl-tRNA synthetase beta chain
MPTINVQRDLLFKELGRTYTQDEFELLCFEFGVELDDVCTLSELNNRGAEAGDGALAAGEDPVVYKIDVPANRNDLLCLEGIALALQVFKKQRKLPDFRLTSPDPAPEMTITVKPEVNQIRPHVVGCVLRGIEFNADTFNSFLDLQDKLHSQICRNRKLVAIGTHDLSTVQGPFTYEALPPEQISFVPLIPKTGETFTAKRLLDYYRDDSNEEGRTLKEYTDIIYDSPVYPAIYDSRRTLLSLPPIINGDHSKMSVDTRDVLIECTATDSVKASTVLNTMVTMFSRYCAKPFTVEPVRVVFEAPTDGRSEIVTPDLEPKRMSAGVDYVRGLAGAPMDEQSPSQIAGLLELMQLSAEVSADGKTLECSIPPTRCDILHPCDIAEDAAIAFGYNNLTKRLPAVVTVGRQQPINHLTDLVRTEVCMAGYTEVLTLGLCSRAENFANLRREDDGRAVVLANPKTQEFQVCRTSMLPGILKTLHCNQAMKFSQGMRLFEVSDVILKDESNDNGARNRRHLGAVYTGLTAGFEIVHGLVDRVMTCLGVAPTAAYAGSDTKRLATTIDTCEARAEYKIVPGEIGTFFPGRCAEIWLQRKGSAAKKVGAFGVLHPDVIKAFGHAFPASALELDLEEFL